MKRRGFLKRNALISGGTLVGGTFISELMADEKVLAAAHTLSPTEKMIRVGCPSHNCGGRCLLKVFVKEGIIVKIETDDRPNDSLEDPQLRACLRGRAYRHRQYHSDRLKYPQIRVGQRGEGKFKRISWDEATDIMAEKIAGAREKYGNESIYIPYGTGSYNQINGKSTANRLMNLMGGSLGYYNSYSWACISKATPYVYGTSITGNQRQDWVNARYILMWGWNPSELRDGTNSEYFLKKAKERGAKIVCIDPRMTLSAVALADEWVAIRPGTDVALMSAMAYVMITEKLYDQDFVSRCCVGFDSGQMPEGLEKEESYKDYILGSFDGQPKDPEWAEAITSVPRETIVRIAREYATLKPGVLYQGYGMQRRAYGEQPVRGGCVLAAITGNVGISGGWASGLALQAKDGGPLWSVFPTLPNPVKARIPSFLWTEAVVRGTELSGNEGLLGTDKLRNNVKLIWCVASNAIINQHGNINRTAEIMKDESLVEFFPVQDNFLTPTAMFADLLLPVCTQFETWGVEDGWKYGEEVILQPRISDPPWETKSDYQICADIAEKLGVGEAYTEGNSERDWIAKFIEVFREARFPHIPDLDAFEKSNQGVYSVPVTEPEIAFADFRKDPVKHPLPTPSGKIEIFSQRLFDIKKPEEIPAVPKYITEWESPFGKEAQKFPLQVIGPHYMPRIHSTMDNVDWLSEAFPQRLFINPIDAKERSLKNGQKAKIYNERGTVILPCRITPRILPGVVAIPQGAWWKPNKKGYDEGGSVNTLTSEKWTPLAFGNAQHTIMAEVELYED
jgi:anaerobic dimethyl sulfoxide reductase subunit A